MNYSLDYAEVVVGKPVKQMHFVLFDETSLNDKTLSPVGVIRRLVAQVVKFSKKI